MNRLLQDTHTFLWWDSSLSQLSKTVLALCRDPSVLLFLSIVSLWEIQNKGSLGKLPLTLPLADIIENQQRRHGLQLLSVAPKHIYALGNLPHHHKAPFDSLLIAQAIDLLHKC